MPDNRKPLMYGAFPVCRNYTVRAHLRHAVPQVRRGCQDAVWCAGPLRRGLYPQHLHPRHGGDEALRRRHHRQRHQPDHVARKIVGEGRMMPSAPLRCFPDLSAFGSRFGSSEKRKNTASLFRAIYAKKFLISDEIRNFLVETAGLEPVTSCV